MKTIEQFAAQRRTDQDDMEKTLFPIVSDAMQHYPAVGWYNDLLATVARLYTDTYHREGGSGQPQQTTTFVADVRDTLEKTSDPTDATVDRVSTWLATAILNAATMEATGTDEEFVVMEWVTMHDDDVRDAHRSVAGQQRPPGEPYDVAGEKLRYPGDPTASIELWINCRCTLAPVLGTEAATTRPVEFRSSELTAPKRQEPDMDETEQIGVPLAWHGVLAPEGVWSGDGRQFSPGSLRFRDLPLPLTWQKASGEGHNGSITVAKIEKIERVENQMRASGTFLSTPEADEAVGLIAEFGKFGVSVDADDAEFEFDEDSAKVTFTSARIASAAMLPIPAFAEAFLALGNAPDGFLPGGDCDPTDPEGECYDPEAVAPTGQASEELKDYTPKQRKDAHTVPGTDSYPIENCQDLRNAIQAIGRAKDPEATKRHIKTQKNRLDCPDVSIPDDWAGEVEEYGRGPGWITNPVDTKRIHDYWTKPGHEGYAKINWGVPGDFNRCRVEVGEEIGENSPEKLLFLNQICAQWHHDALGYWPGRAPSEQVSALHGDPGPALTLVAGGGFCAPSEWFKDPCFDHETPLTVAEDGQVFGHLAGWKTCHTAYKGTCVAPPHSLTSYAYFLTGAVLTESGTVPVGQITIGGGHAPYNASMRAAIAHYDNTSTVVADVTCGEDAHGIWLAGMVRPGVSDEMIYALRASSLSGDWRSVNNPDDLELVAALAVNSPGFPVPRVGIAAGVQVALVAAGVVMSEHGDEGLDLEAFAAAVERVIASRDERRRKMAELAQRVGGGQ